MTLSLYTAVVGTYQQMLPQVARLINKAEDHCRENGLTSQELGEYRLAPDMWPWAKQISQCAHHSARAIEAVRKGAFSPDPDPIAPDFALLRNEIDDAIAFVNAIDPDELDAIAERDMEFRAGKYAMMFNVSDFLLTFTLPNFYFHVATAYDILRLNGVPLGKADFIGRMRNKA